MKNNNNMKYYFYCPYCKYEEIAATLPKGTVGNPRDGFGTPIHHYECPKCHNLDAGYMNFNLDMTLKLPTKEQKQYFQNIINKYQNIRGFKK